MSACYIRLWKLLLEKNIKRTDLISVAGISSNIVAKMGRNEYVSMESLEKICRALKCDICDICDVVEFVTEENTGEHKSDFCGNKK